MKKQLIICDICEDEIPQDESTNFRIVQTIYDIQGVPLDSCNECYSLMKDAFTDEKKRIMKLAQKDRGEK